MSRRAIIQSAFRPVDHREIWEWFEQEGTLPSCYAATGKFGSDLAPMCKPVFRALKSKTVRDVTVMAGVQCIKTLIGEGFLLWSIPNNPGPMQWLQPTDEEAKEHVRERFMALIENFPTIMALLSDSRHDKTAAFLQFVNSTLRMEGCGQGNLQRKSIKTQMRSEVWQSDKWIPGRLKEASSRMTQFQHNSKSYTESQAGYDAEMMVDDMHAWWKEGSGSVWNFRCLDCRKLQPFHWTYFRQDGTRAGMRWEDSERTRRAGGEWRFNELIQTVRYECIYCGHQHIDNPITRRRMSEEANCEFVASNPDAPATHESFAWNQLAMPNLPWFETRQGGVKNFLIAWEQAKRGYDKPLREFFQKVVNEPYHPAKHSAVERMNTVEVNTAATDGIEYQGVKFPAVMLGVDVQADHFWACVEAFSARGDSVVLWAGRLLTWDEVSNLQKEWKVAPYRVCVDQSHRGAEVLMECTMRGGVIDTGRKKVWSSWSAMRGSDAADFASQEPGHGRTIRRVYTVMSGDPCQGLHLSDPRRGALKGKGGCWIFTWSNPTIKDVLIARRDGRARGIQCFVNSGDWTAELGKHMYSQVKRHVPSKYGSSKWKWQTISGRPDHLFDCRCMMLTRAFVDRLMVGQADEKKDVDEKPET